MPIATVPKPTSPYTANNLRTYRADKMGKLDSDITLETDIVPSEHTKRLDRSKSDENSEDQHVGKVEYISYWPSVKEEDFKRQEPEQHIKQLHENYDSYGREGVSG